ncbi:hypothetical protein PLCT1_01036 [Planctomycetaceae bacterium]|nr:hypothetical protein PLCT1_01036 [Planctomycetaceae bacterium]
MKLRLFVIGLALALLLSGTVMAQGPLQGYDISWWTVDGGGSAISGGIYELHSTIGQPDAGILSVGSYTLAGGFWSGATASYKVYLPVILR